MNRNSLRVIISFSVIILLISTVCFFWIDYKEDTFVPTCLSMVFSTLVYTLSTISLHNELKKEEYYTNITLQLIIFYSILVTLILVKLFISL